VNLVKNDTFSIKSFGTRFFYFKIIP